MILKDWNDYELGEIVEIKKEKYNPKKEEIDYPCIELEHINQVIGTINGYTSSIQQSSIKNKFVKGDVLYGKLRPYLRKYYLCKFDGVCSSEIWVFNGKKVTNEYLFYFIQDDRFNNIANVSTGSKMPRADWSFMEGYAFRIPKIDEQHRIVEVLSSCDLLIEKQQQLIEKKKLFKKGLAQNLLTGEIRGKNYTEEFNEVKLKDILKELKEKSTINNQFEILSVTKEGVFLQNEYFNRQIASENNIGYKVVRRKNLVFSSMNLWMGSVDVLTNFEVGIVSPACKVFYVNEKIVDIYFFKYLVRSNKMINLYILNSEQGASVVRRNLDLDGLLSSRIKLPSIEEQREIGLILKTADKEIELLEKELEALKLQKKGLMQRLLTGEVRVKV